MLELSTDQLGFLELLVRTYLNIVKVGTVLLLRFEAVTALFVEINDLSFLVRTFSQFVEL